MVVCKQSRPRAYSRKSCGRLGNTNQSAARPERISEMTIVDARKTAITSSGIHKWIVPRRLAFATLKPSEMKDFLFVSTYNTFDPDSPAPKNHGYQRDPMKGRSPQIGRYYKSHPHLITPLILSVRLDDPDEIEEFERMLNSGDLKGIIARWDKARVSIVDGQHRSGGLIWVHENELNMVEDFEAGEKGFDPPVPVMLYFGLSYEDEAEMFDTINTTQRKLPKALIEVTKGDITERDQRTHAQSVREVAFSLARDKDSVWLDQVNMSGARDPDKKVTYEGLRRSTANMFPAELMGRIVAKEGLEGPAKYAKVYWSMVADACQSAWEERPRITKNDDTGEAIEVPAMYRLKELVGVAALARLGKDIITSAMDASRFVKFEGTMSDLVSKLSEVDWEKRDNNPWVASEAGFAGQRELYQMLYQLVYNDVKPGEGASNA